MRSVLLIALCLFLIPALAQKKSVPYVIMVSFDGFRHDYVSQFNPPAFKAFIQQGAAAEGLIPAFPSKTFPNHYTLVTGLYPGNHGLVDNTFYDPDQHKKYTMRNMEAVHDSSFYGGVPVWQLAQKQGIKTASYFWVGSEVKLKGEYPTYYLPYKESTPNEQRVEQTIAWLQLPENERPHFISLYFSLIDSEGHKSGPRSEGLKKSVLEADGILAMLMDGLKRIKLPVNVIIVSDHGMMELKPVKETYIFLYNLVNVADTSNVFMNGGTQAHVYTRKPDSLYNVFKKQENHFKVYRNNEFPQSWHYQHARSGDLLVVAEPGYYIIDQPRSAGSWALTAFGAHGFDPFIGKDMQGIFYASGPNIRKGKQLKPFENIHVYPLIAKILGLKTPPIDGDIKVLEGIYRD